MPTGTQVIVQPCADTNVNRPLSGKVLAIGNQVFSVAPGYVVYFPREAGQPHQYEGKSCLVINEDDIINIERQ